MENYPSIHKLRSKQEMDSWMPDLLRTFLNNLICNDIKRLALGHSIIQAVKPKSVFSVGVSLDHVFGSSNLIRFLYRLGFSISYDEVTRFKQPVVQQTSDDLPASYPFSFTQYAADNIDHNVCTLDGSGTFHGMGIISMSTPCSNTVMPGDFADVIPVLLVVVLKILLGAKAFLLLNTVQVLNLL
jgi:hypothetical protein